MKSVWELVNPDLAELDIGGISTSYGYLGRYLTLFGLRRKDEEKSECRVTLA